MSTKPKSFYKYQPIGPHTGLNLVMLAEQRCLYLPKKSALNDPTDCEPHIAIERNRKNLESAILRLASLPEEDYHGKAARKLHPRLIEAINSRSALFQKEGNAPGDKLLIGDQVHSLIYRFIRRQVGIPGVFSMSGSWDIPEMWSHYADSHKGICFQLTGFPSTDSDFLFEKVNYTGRRPQLVLEDVVDINDGSTRSKRTLSSIYCEKSNAWLSENEFRLVSRNTKQAQSQVKLSLPSGNFVHFPSLRLEAVYFGMRCGKLEIENIIDIIEDRLVSDTEPKFFKIKQSPSSYELERTEISDRMMFWMPTNLENTPQESSDDDIPF